MPTRKFKSSPVKVTGTVPNDQRFESTLEQDYFTLLRFDLTVDHFEAQPVEIDWYDDLGARHSYTPDVLVHFKHGPDDSSRKPTELVEVKPDPESKDGLPKHPIRFRKTAKPTKRNKPTREELERQNALKWEAATVYSYRKGWKFLVVRESEIRTPFLDNARFLLRFLERPLLSDYSAEMLSRLADCHEGISLRQWAAQTGNSPAPATVFPSCYRLIAQRQVKVDLTVKLSLDSIIFPAKING
jgi:hypothetical protein